MDDGPPSKKAKVEESGSRSAQNGGIQAALLEALSGGSGNASGGLGDLLRKAMQSVAAEQQMEQQQQNEIVEDNIRPNREVPEEYPPEYRIETADAVKLKYPVLNGSDSQFVECKSEFQHQVFTADDYILGYKNIQVKFCYSPMWRVMVEVKHQGEIEEGKLKDADALSQIRKSQIKPLKEEDFTTDEETFKQWLAEERQQPLPGDRLGEQYTVNGKTFEVRKHRPKTEADQMYLCRLESMSLWFIEASSWTSFEDDNFHFYTVHEVDPNTNTHVTVGYLLVYCFTNPFKDKEKPYIYRVCQTIVIPPYRKQGHGYRMLEATYNDALEAGNVLEVNAEDPCLGFTILRDVLDVVRCLKMNIFGVNDGIIHFEYGIVPAGKLIEIRNRTKMTAKQIQKVYEIIRLLNCSENETEDNGSNEKKLRLDVKRRLRVEHGEDLDSLADPGQVKEQLNLLFGDLEEHYRVVLEKVKAIIAKE